MALFLSDSMNTSPFYLARRCLTLTNLFTVNPLAILFVAPYDPPEEIAAEYHAQVPTPMDLKTVKSKLQEAKYASLNEWVKDMNLIFDNAIKFNGADSVIGGVARYLKEKLQRNVERFELCNARTFEARLIEANKKLQEAIEAIPSATGVVAVHDEICPGLADFTSERFDAIKRGLNKISTGEKMTDIAAIIKRYNRDVLYGPHPKIDVARLSRHTLLLLEDMIKKAQDKPKNPAPPQTQAIPGPKNENKSQISDRPDNS